MTCVRYASGVFVDFVLGILSCCGFTCAVLLEAVINAVFIDQRAKHYQFWLASLQSDFAAYTNAMVGERSIC